MTMSKFTIGALLATLLAIGPAFATDAKACGCCGGKMGGMDMGSAGEKKGGMCMGSMDGMGQMQGPMPGPMPSMKMDDAPAGAQCGKGQSCGKMGLGMGSANMPDASSSPQAEREADVAFAKLVQAHRQAAMSAAQEVLQSGTDPELRKLAEEMLLTQDKDLALVKSWLKKAQN